MIVLKTKIKRKGMKAGGIRKATVEGFRGAGAYWQESVLDRHFLTSAKAKYGYKKRVRSYVISKARRFGHTRPLELTGALRRKVNLIQDIRVNSKGGKVYLHGPRNSRGGAYLHMTRKDFNQPDKARELRTTPMTEQEELTVVFDSETQKEINKNDPATAKKARSRTVRFRVSV